MISCHSHSGLYCNHGYGKLADCVQRAVDLNFKVFCLTEHMPRYREIDLYANEVEMNLKPKDTLGQFQEFYQEARMLQKTVTDCHILVGMEIEWIYDNTFAELQELIQQYPCDILVGSVHHLRSIPLDYDIPTLERIESIISTEEMFQEYFDEQYDMLRAVKPMIIGHFDLIRLWRSDFPLSTLVWTKIERNIDFINSYGGLVELNSRAYKKGLPSAYPLQDILEMMIRKGTKFTLSDDSHGPDDVAMHYPKLKQYCRQMGIQTVYAPWKAGNIVEIKEFPVSQVLGPW